MLQQLSRYFRIAVYSRLSLELTLKILAAVDKSFLVWKVLGREDFVWAGGRPKRDLLRVCSDMRRIVLIDHDYDAVVQRQNMMPVSRFGPKNAGQRDSALRVLADFFHNAMRNRDPEIDMRDVVRARPLDSENSEMADLL